LHCMRPRSPFRRRNCKCATMASHVLFQWCTSPLQDELPIIYNGVVAPTVDEVTDVESLPIPANVRSVNLQWYANSNTTYQLQVNSSDPAVLPPPSYGNISATGSCLETLFSVVCLVGCLVTCGRLPSVARHRSFHGGNPALGVQLLE